MTDLLPEYINIQKGLKTAFRYLHAFIADEYKSTNVLSLVERQKNTTQSW